MEQTRQTQGAGGMSMGPDSFIRLRDNDPNAPSVERLTGLRRTAIYERVRKGTFPKPRRLSYRVSLWSMAEVQQWIRSVKEQGGAA